ncbi:MAG: hypothetical protein RR319_01275 [Bacteroides sp.]
MGKNKGVQIGNFVVTKYGSTMEYIKVSSISNNWSMAFREDNPQFKFIQILANENDKHEYLEAFIKLNYCMNNAVMDMEFMNEFLSSYKGLNERNEAKRLASQNGITDEEDKAIIEEQRRIYEEQHNPEDE